MIHKGLSWVNILLIQPEVAWPEWTELAHFDSSNPPNLPPFLLLMRQWQGHSHHHSLHWHQVLGGHQQQHVLAHPSSHKLHPNPVIPTTRLSPHLGLVHCQLHFRCRAHHQCEQRWECGGSSEWRSRRWSSKVEE